MAAQCLGRRRRNGLASLTRHPLERRPRLPGPHPAIAVGEAMLLHSRGWRQRYHSEVAKLLTAPPGERQESLDLLFEAVEGHLHSDLVPRSRTHRDSPDPHWPVRLFARAAIYADALVPCSRAVSVEDGMQLNLADMIHNLHRADRARSEVTDATRTERGIHTARNEEIAGQRLFRWVEDGL